jgi:hypothetical protein
MRSHDRPRSALQCLGLFLFLEIVGPLKSPFFDAFTS